MTAARLDHLRTLAWAVKKAPQCPEDCPFHRESGVCLCGGLVLRWEAECAFRDAVTPDVVLDLVNPV